MIHCKICNVGCKSIRALSKHIRDQHIGYDSKMYYDTFLLDSTPTCKVCGIILTAFQGLSKGYLPTCSHKCGGIYNRKMLSLNPEKNNKFKEKVSANQTKIWNERKVTGTDIEIHRKASNTNKASISVLTDSQRKERFGWLSKLSTTDKLHWVETVMRQTGMHRWWITATEAEIEKVVLKRNASKLGISVDQYVLRLSDVNDKELYCSYVRLLTERTYLKYRDEIDPYRLRSKSYHLDHRYSVVQGYYDRIDPKIIASKHNLEIIPGVTNSKKNSKCSISLSELQEKFYGTTI